MTVFVVVLTYWVLSGLLMAIYDATDRTQVWAIEGGGPGARLNDAAVTALPIPDPASLASGISAAQASIGQLPVASVDLRMTGSIPRLEFAEASGDRNTMGRFYAETGAPMTALVADGDPDADVPAYVTKRNTLKAWHRGNIAGLTGQFIGLFTGLALIVLTITGVLLYFKLWNARRAAGRHGFFWQTKDSLWRRLHRWTSIVVAAFVLNIAISGCILAYGEIQLHFFLDHGIGAPLYPRPSPLPPVSAGVLPREVNTLLQTAYQAALKDSPTARITAIQLIQRDGIAKSLVTLGGETPKTLAFNAASGQPVADWTTGGVQVGNGYFADWHQAVKRIHRGDIIGHFGGRFIDMGAGLALLYLVISSLALYFDMFQRRNKLGRKGWFWK